MVSDFGTWDSSGQRLDRDGRGPTEPGSTVVQVEGDDVPGRHATLARLRGARLGEVRLPARR